MMSISDPYMFEMRGRGKIGQTLISGDVRRLFGINSVQHHTLFLGHARMLKNCTTAIGYYSFSADACSIMETYEAQRGYE